MSSIAFPPYSVSPIDPKTGQWTREWWLFLQFQWNRTGGSNGQSSSDLATDMPEDAGIEETKAELYAIRDALSQSPPVAALPSDDDSHGRLQSLEALVADLRKEIEALKQGTML